MASRTPILLGVLLCGSMVLCSCGGPEPGRLKAGAKANAPLTGWLVGQALRGGLFAVNLAGRDPREIPLIDVANGSSADNREVTLLPVEDLRARTFQHIVLSPRGDVLYAVDAEQGAIVVWPSGAKEYRLLHRLAETRDKARKVAEEISWMSPTPDGTRLYFHISGPDRLMGCEAASGKSVPAVKIPSSWGFGWPPGWTGPRKLLVMIGKKPGRFTFRTLDVETGALCAMPKPGGTVSAVNRGFSLSPDGTSVCVRTEAGYDVYAYPSCERITTLPRGIVEAEGFGGPDADGYLLLSSEHVLFGRPTEVGSPWGKIEGWEVIVIALPAATRKDVVFGSWLPLGPTQFFRQRPSWKPGMPARARLRPEKSLARLTVIRPATACAWLE